MMSFLLLYTTVEFLIEIVYAKERFPEKKAAVLLDFVQIRVGALSKFVGTFS